MRTCRRRQTRVPGHVKTELTGILASLTREMSVWLMAGRLGVDQPKASALSHGHLEIFSVERLIVFTTRLGCDVEIRIGPPPRTLHRGPRTGRLTPHKGTIRVVDDTEGRPAGLFR